MVLICLAYAFGLLAVSAGGWPSLLAALAGILILALSAALRSGTSALLIVAIAGLGAARYTTYTRPLPNDISSFAFGKRVRVTGVVMDDSALAGHKLTTIVSVSEIETNGRRRPVSGRLWTRFYLPNSVPLGHALPDYGDIVSFNCFLRRPVEFSNSDSFSWPKYLARKRIFATAYSRLEESDLEFHPGAGGGFLGRAAHAMREGLLALMNKRFPPREAGTAAGILLGITTDLPLDDRIAFQRSGTYHLLAASGFNCLVIMIVFGRYVFPWLRIHKRLSHALLIAMLIRYTMICGGSPSIIRAALMASLYLFAFLIGRVEDSLNIFAAAALFILIARPTDLFDVGFQLSFAAAGSIILILPLLRLWGAAPRPVRMGWRRTLWYPYGETLEAVTATSAVTIGTMPLTANYFNQVSLVSIPANAMVAMLAVLVFVITIPVLALGWIPVIGPLINGLGVRVVDELLWVVRTFGLWKYASLLVRPLNAPIMAGYYLLMGLGVWYASERLTQRKR